MKVVSLDSCRTLYSYYKTNIVDNEYSWFKIKQRKNKHYWRMELNDYEHEIPDEYIVTKLPAYTFEEVKSTYISPRITIIYLERG